METKTLPHLALDDIAANSRFDVFAGDSQSETRMTKVVSPRQERQVFATEFAGFGENSFEFFRFEQPETAGKATRPAKVGAPTGSVMQGSVFRPTGEHGPWRGEP